MRYEHLELDLPTACCDQLERAIQAIPRNEITEGILNLENELRARLQRRDIDPHSPKNPAPADWMDL